MPTSHPIRLTPAWAMAFSTCLLVLACGNQEPQATTTPSPLLPRVWEWEGDILRIHLEYGNLTYKGTGTGQRAVIDNGIKWWVEDHDGAEYLRGEAQSALSIAPFADISLYAASMHTPDGYAYDCKEMLWPYQGDHQAWAMLGHTLIATDALLLEGDTLIGDPLLVGYEILHVLGITALDCTGIEE